MFTSLDENVDGQDKITFGDNSKGKVQGLGKVAISNDLSISNVLLVAPLSFNLLSVGQLCDLGLQCLFTPSEVIVTKMDDESMVFKGFRYNNLYLVDFTSEDADLRTCLFTKASLGWLWHRRLAHVGMSTLKKVLKKDMVRGLKDVVFEKDKPCSACQAGKQVANTHCKENGPRAFWLIEFWCLMNNTIRELISFLVFVFVVHRMRRELDQGNEDATPQKKT